MKYRANFQYLPRYGDRLVDGRIIDDITSEDNFFAIPNIGDHVSLTQPRIDIGDDINDEPLFGVVKSRHFEYINDHCLINIVITDSDIDRDLLIKL
jgi:hypothetical protein